MAYTGTFTIQDYNDAGASGLNTAVAILYKRSETLPAGPTTATTYTFGTGEMTGQNNGWTREIPASDGNPLWVVQSVASEIAPTATSIITSWSSPVKIVENGETGSPGYNSAVIYLYQRKTTVPTTTDISELITYTFATKEITDYPTSTGAWTTTIPAGTDPLYAVVATASNNTATDTIARSEWGTPQTLAQNGVDGTPAKLITLVTSAQVLNSPVGGGATVPATSIITGIVQNTTISIWEYSVNGGDFSTTLPTGVSRVGGTVTITGSTMTAQTMSVRASDGTYSDTTTVAKLEDGADGTSPIVGYLTNESHVVSADSDGTGYSLTNAGGTFKIYEGTTDRTTSSSFSGNTTKNGLTISIGASTGVYSLSGTWTTDNEFFDLTGVYGGVTIIKRYVISKSKVGVQGLTGPAGDDANLLPWVEAWNGDPPTVTAIGLKYVVSPKIFAGVFSPSITGVSLGVDKDGEVSNNILGYSNGILRYTLNQDKFEIGTDVNSAGINVVGDTGTSTRFWAGKTYAQMDNAPFRVTQGGHLYASDATISGEIDVGGNSSISGELTASSGKYITHYYNHGRDGGILLTGGGLNVSGQEIVDADHGRTNFIPILGGMVIMNKITLTYSTAFAFYYDEDKVFLSSETINTSLNYFGTKTLFTPSGVRFVRFVIGYSPDGSSLQEFEDWPSTFNFNYELYTYLETTISGQNGLQVFQNYNFLGGLDEFGLLVSSQLRAAEADTPFLEVGKSPAIYGNPLLNTPEDSIVLNFFGVSSYFRGINFTGFQDSDVKQSVIRGPYSGLSITFNETISEDDTGHFISMRAISPYGLLTQDTSFLRLEVETSHPGSSMGIEYEEGGLGQIKLIGVDKVGPYYANAEVSGAGTGFPLLYNADGQVLVNGELTSVTEINNAKYWNTIDITANIDTIIDDGVYKIVGTGTAHSSHPVSTSGGILIVNHAPDQIYDPTYQTYFHNSLVYTRIRQWQGGPMVWLSWYQISGPPLAMTVSSTLSNTYAGHRHSLDLSGRTLTAGNGLSGGGTLGADRTFTLGTPSTCSTTTSNAVTATSHTHDITGVVPSTGGTFTGTVQFDMPTATGKHFYMDASGSGSEGSEPTFRPTEDAYGFLGTSSYRHYKGYATAWETTSSLEYKQNLQLFDKDEAYELIKEMPVYAYQHKNRDDLQLGVLVEDSPIEIIDIGPNENDMKSIDGYSYTSLLLSAVQKLQEKIEILENELSVIKGGQILGN